MKKIFTPVIFSLISLLSFADDHHNDGKLSITNLSKQDIHVEVDGHFFDDRNNVVVIPALSPGYHTVKVYRTKKNGYRDFNRRGKSQLIYNSSVYVKPRFEVEIAINRNGKVMVKENRIRNQRGRDYNNDRRGSDRDRDDRFGDHYNGPVNDPLFGMLLESLRRERFEATRMDMARQMVERNYFKVAQVKQLAQLFSFENNRLELAKCAYGKTTDRQYYSIMYDVLSLNDSRRALAQYINTFR